MTLWQVTPAKEALELAGAEAAKYVEGTSLRYLGSAQSYRLSHEPQHGSEVFSLLRDSDLAPDKNVEAFFDTGREHQSAVD